MNCSINILFYQRGCSLGFLLNKSNHKCRVYNGMFYCLRLLNVDSQAKNLGVKTKKHVLHHFRVSENQFALLFTSHFDLKIIVNSNLAAMKDEINTQQNKQACSVRQMTIWFDFDAERKSDGRCKWKVNRRRAFFDGCASSVSGTHTLAGVCKLSCVRASISLCDLWYLLCAWMRRARADALFRSRSHT